jgi:hypothetical protein
VPRRHSLRSGPHRLRLSPPPLARPPSFTYVDPCGCPGDAAASVTRRCSALARLRPVPGSVTRSLMSCGCCCVLAGPYRAPCARCCDEQGRSRDRCGRPRHERSDPVRGGPTLPGRRMFRHFTVSISVSEANRVSRREASLQAQPAPWTGPGAVRRVPRSRTVGSVRRGGGGSVPRLVLVTSRCRSDVVRQPRGGQVGRP